MSDEPTLDERADERRAELVDELWRDFETCVEDPDGLARRFALGSGDVTGCIELVRAMRGLLDDEPVTLDQAGPDADGRFGRYEALDAIARGGMGQVWRARDPELGREVAIKVLRPGVGSREHALARFVDEGRITGQLEHPSILPIHDMGRTSDGRPFVCMKLVRGEALDERLRRLAESGGLAAERPALLEVLLKVCDAIAFAHARGVLHRDLKPGNVMCGAFGEVLVLDWGLAKAAGSPEDGAGEPIDLDGADVDRTLAGTLVGTPGYMSPEQADGRVGDIGPHSDVYALGGLLYAVLTGGPPFSGTSTREVLAEVSAGQLERPSERVPDLPRELEAIVLKAMAHAPSARYASASALREDLVRFDDGLPVAALEYSPLQRLAKWVGRRRGSLLAAAAAALVVIAAGAHDQWQKRQRIVQGAIVRAEQHVEGVPDAASLLSRLERGDAARPDDRAHARKLAVGLALLDLGGVTASDDPGLRRRRADLLRRLAAATALVGETGQARQALGALAELGEPDLGALTAAVERACRGH